MRVTNLDKVLFPARDGEAPVTKRNIIRYSAQIAPTEARDLPRPDRRRDRGRTWRR